MQTREFLKYNRQFNIAGFLYPHIGGPHGYLSHLIQGGDEKAYWQTVAQKIEFIAPRPNFEAASLDVTSLWQLDPAHEMALEEHEMKHDYKEPCFLIPRFTGDGHVYTLVGAKQYLTDDECWHHCCWSAIDTQTSVRKVLEIIRDLIKNYEVQFITRWKLLYVLKTSWKAADPKRRSYEIFTPSEEWVREHAYFPKP